MKKSKFYRGSNARGRRKFRRCFGFTPIAKGKPDEQKKKEKEVKEEAWPSPQV